MRDVTARRHLRSCLSAVIRLVCAQVLDNRVLARRLLHDLAV